MSNRYATRAGSEHPIKIWSFDDFTHYVSLATDDERDISTWALTDAAVVKLEKGSVAGTPLSEAPLTKVSPTSVAGVDAPAIPYMLDSPVVFDDTDIHPNIPIDISAFVKIAVPGLDYIEIGSTSLLEKNYISAGVDNEWVKISGRVLPEDGDMIINFVPKINQQAEALEVYVNGVTIGQYSEPASSYSIGVDPVNSNALPVKGVSVSASANSVTQVLSELETLQANTITIPVRVDIASATSHECTIDPTSLAFAKSLASKMTKDVRVIVEPYPWITGGTVPETSLNPTDVSLWFASWSSVLTTLNEEFNDAWGLYIASNFVLLEDEIASWRELIRKVKTQTRAKVIYRTNWWYTATGDIGPGSSTEAYENKLANPIFGLPDIIAIAAYFELSSLDAPTQEQLEYALRDTTVNARGQDVYAEVHALGEAWEKPIIFGELGVPGVDGGAKNPWNPNVSVVENTTVQKNLIDAYQNVFAASRWYQGFSLFCIGHPTFTTYTLLPDAEAEVAGYEKLPASSPFIDGVIPNHSAIKTYSPEPSIHYVIEDNRLLARSTSIPLASGSRDSLRLTPSLCNAPALVIDGQGFLSELGRRDTFTVEFWMRISGTAASPIKVFGHTASSDGLYVHESILSLSIGDKVVSANVPDLSDPSLFHIVYSDGIAEVLVNAEKVITMSVDEDALVLPQNGLRNEKKWLGFWTHEDLDPVYLDCVTIYAYRVNEIIAKRRFVWGQGVADVGILNAQYNGQTAYADFSTSRATTNISYPDNHFWYNGQNKNLKTEKYKLSVPEYNLPEVVFESKSLSEWYEDHYLMGTTSISMRPSDAWNEEQVYFKFGSFGEFISNPKGLAIKWSAVTVPFGMQYHDNYDELDALYAGGTMDDVDTFYNGQTYAELVSVEDPNQPLILIQSKINTSNALKVYTDSVNIYVDFVLNGVTTKLLEEPISIETDYLTYINLDGAKESYNGTNISQEVKNFLSDKSNLEILVGGNGDVTFKGTIYNFSFIDEYYSKMLLPTVDATYTWAADVLTVTTTNKHGLSAGDIITVNYLTGGATSTVESYARVATAPTDTTFTIAKNGSGAAGTMTFLSPHIATNMPTNMDQFDICSYTLMPKTDFGKFYLDIGVRGYWTDYIPLQTLAGVAYDEYGNPGSALDLIQFNIGYPVTSETLDLESQAWKYSELYGEGYTYSALASEFANYGSLHFSGPALSRLRQRATTNSFVSSYISFQGSTGEILDFGDLGESYPATTADLVYANLLDEPQNSRIEVVNGTSIIPPRNKRIEDMVMVTYLEVVVPGIKTYPVSLRSLEFSSYAMSRQGFTEIGSKYNKSLYPFVSNGFFYDFNSVAPFKINKRGMPLLFQGEESGFTPLGSAPEGVSQGMFLDFSKANSSSFEVDSAQLWIKRNDIGIPLKKKVFEFVFANSTNSLSGRRIYSFYLEPYFDDPQRMIMKVYNELGNEVTHTGELEFSQNGGLVKAPVVDRDEWTAIAIGFNSETNRTVNGKFYINIFSEVTFNNISVFQPLEDFGQLVQYRKWINVDDMASDPDLIPDPDDRGWQYWKTDDWNNVLSSAAVKITAQSVAKNIYDTYLGKRLLAIESYSDMRLAQDTIRHYSDNSWLTQVLIPT